MAVDASGHTHVTGTFAGRADFGNNTLFSMGISDVFVTKLDREGRVIWARQAGAQFSEPIAGHALAVDRGGNTYVVGYYRGNITFGDHVLKSLGETDIFVTKVTAQTAPAAEARWPARRTFRHDRLPQRPIPPQGAGPHFT